MKRLLFSLLVALFLLQASLFARAELRVDISGVGANQIPIAVATFANESISGQSASAIIKADLQRSGMFRLIDAVEVISETTPVNFGSWKAKGADALVIGSVTQMADGRFELRYKLLDTVKTTELSAMGLAVDKNSCASYRIAWLMTSTKN